MLYGFKADIHVHSRNAAHITEMSHFLEAGGKFSDVTFHGGASGPI